MFFKNKLIEDTPINQLMTETKAIITLDINQKRTTTRYLQLYFATSGEMLIVESR